ncbi:MAG: hypothetical protein MJ173_09580 [Clostridia bacterium]|nr:hypothetical protein [Clostridia bacterium]
MKKNYSVVFVSVLLVIACVFSVCANANKTGTVNERIPDNTGIYPSASEPHARTTLPATTLPQTTLPATTLPQTTLPPTTLPQTTLPPTTRPRPQTTLPPTTCLVTAPTPSGDYKGGKTSIRIKNWAAGLMSPFDFIMGFLLSPVVFIISFFEK